MTRLDSRKTSHPPFCRAVMLLHMQKCLALLSWIEIIYITARVGPKAAYILQYYCRFLIYSLVHSVCTLFVFLSFTVNQTFMILIFKYLFAISFCLHLKWSHAHICVLLCVVNYRLKINNFFVSNTISQFQLLIYCDFEFNKRVNYLQINALYFYLNIWQWVWQYIMLKHS